MTARGAGFEYSGKNLRSGNFTNRKVERFKLSGGFGTAGASKRASAWAGEGHVPEINFRIDEFQTDIHFAVAFAPGGNYARFDGAVGILIDQEQGLTGTDHFVQNQQGSLLVNRTSHAFHAEFFADFVFAVDNHGNSQGNPKGTPTLSIAKMKNSHQYASCHCKARNLECYGENACSQAGTELKGLSVPLAEAW
jgi:hypothetical protein